MGTVIDRANELVQKIYNAMGTVDKCDGLLDKISDREVAFVTTESELKVTYLDGVLTEEQMKQIKELACRMIQDNKQEAEAYLKKLTEEESSEKAAEPEAVEEAEASETESSPVELTDELVKTLYTDVPGATLESVATELGVSKSKLHKYITEHGLKKPKADNTPWRTGKNR